jgi:hypothetical protein
LDIATDEDMEGGGKEIAIDLLIKKLEAKGLSVPRRRLIFVGDSLRGDLGSSLIKVGEKMNIRGTGVLVLKDKNAFLEIQKQINTDESLKRIAESMDIYGFVVSDVPLDERGKPLLLSRYSKKFLRKL